MGPTGRVLARALTWPLTPLLTAATGAVLLARPGQAGPFLAPADVPYVVATFACWLVGVVLTGRVFEQAAGWAFLGLGTALAWSGLIDVYTELALIWRPEAPAGALAATLSDTSFVWWFVFLALVLQYTPPTRASSWFQRRLPRVTVATGVVYQVTALLRSTHLDHPHEDLISPGPSTTSAACLPWFPR